MAFSNRQILNNYLVYVLLEHLQLKIVANFLSILMKIISILNVYVATIWYLLAKNLWDSLINSMLKMLIMKKSFKMEGESFPLSSMILIGKVCLLSTTKSAFILFLHWTIFSYQIQCMMKTDKPKPVLSSKSLFLKISFSRISNS